MDEPKKTDFEDAAELGLIDFSSEDHCLIFSSSSPLQKDEPSESHEQQIGSNSLKATEVYRTGNITNALEQKGQPHQLSETMEPERSKRVGKCNLRKSLAWDSAFFTNAGVLDPEELSSITGGNKSGEKNTLPMILEDLRQSTDSISTLDSDSLRLESIEADLFVDIRASIKKSSFGNKIANLGSKSVPGESDTRLIPSKKTAVASPYKSIGQTVLKKTGSAQKSGMTIKQSSVFPQATQPTNRTRVSSPSIQKPPKVVGRVNPTSAVQTKRISTGDNRAKIDNDNAKGRGAPLKIPRLSDSQKKAAGRGAEVMKLHSVGEASRIAPQDRVPSGFLTKARPPTPRSSVDSSSSVSSENVGKSPSNFQKRKIDSKTTNVASSGSFSRTPTRTALRNTKVPGNPKLSAYVKSLPKPSPSISPASSISEWSCESSSSTSTAKQHCDNSKRSIKCGSPRKIPVKEEASQASGVLRSLNDKPSDERKNQGSGLALRKPSTGGRGIPTSLGLAKPSGLKMPSPKIGFFDGVKAAAAYTPKGNAQSQSALQTGLSKVAAGATGQGEGSNTKNSRKRETAKVDSRESTARMKPKSVTPVKTALTGSPILSYAGKDAESSEISPELQNDQLKPLTSVEDAKIDSPKHLGGSRHAESSDSSSEAHNHAALDIGVCQGKTLYSDTEDLDIVMHVGGSELDADGTGRESDAICNPESDEQDSGPSMQPNSPVQDVAKDSVELASSSMNIECCGPSKIQEVCFYETGECNQVTAEISISEGHAAISDSHMTFGGGNFEGCLQIATPPVIRDENEETTLTLQHKLLMAVQDAPADSIESESSSMNSECCEVPSKIQEVLIYENSEASLVTAEISVTGGHDAALDSHLTGGGKSEGCLQTGTPTIIQDENEETTLDMQPKSLMPVQNAPTDSIESASSSMNSECCEVPPKIQEVLFYENSEASQVTAEISVTGGHAATLGSHLTVEGETSEGCLQTRTATIIQDENEETTLTVPPKSLTPVQNAPTGPTKALGAVMNAESTGIYLEAQNETSLENGQILRASPVDGANCEHSPISSSQLLSKSNEKEESCLDDEIENLSRLIEAIDLNKGQRMDIDKVSLPQSHVSLADTIGPLNSSCCRELGYAQKGEVEKKITSRVPLAAKNSFCNNNEMLDISKC